MKLLLLIALLYPIQMIAADLLELRYILPTGEPRATKRVLAGEELWLSRQVVITDKDVKKSYPYQQEAEWGIMVELTEEGSKRFDEMAAKHLGERLGIVVKNKLVSAPVVREKKFGGTLQISGSFSKDEATRLATAMNAGKP